MLQRNNRKIYENPENFSQNFKILLTKSLLRGIIIMAVFVFFDIHFQKQDIPTIRGIGITRMVTSHQQKNENHSFHKLRCQKDKIFKRSGNML